MRFAIFPRRLRKNSDPGTGGDGAGREADPAGGRANREVGGQSSLLHDDRHDSSELPTVCQCVSVTHPTGTLWSRATWLDGSTSCWTTIRGASSRGCRAVLAAAPKPRLDFDWRIRAASLSVKYGVTFCDATYHAVALGLGGVYVTADERYVRRASAAGGVSSLRLWQVG